MAAPEEHIVLRSCYPEILKHPHGFRHLAQIESSPPLTRFAVAHPEEAYPYPPVFFKGLEYSRLAD